MQDPVDKMVIRTALHETLEEDTDRLKFRASPVGGAFGLVRSSGTKAHAGWDLYSSLYAPVYAVTDSLVVSVSSSFGAEECKQNSYGNSVCILLTDPRLKELRDKFKCDLFAFYGHLASVAVDVGDQLREGWVIGTVGRSGNACHSPSHLHFEIRTIATPPSKSGVRYRIDPGELFGYDKYSSRDE
jgi:murein DD-endopeptidase MepM/ murein hydrolase activator NlpD